MKKHSKIGGKKGRPAYRTPSTFIAKRNFASNRNMKRGNIVRTRRGI